MTTAQKNEIVLMHGTKGGRSEIAEELLHSNLLTPTQENSMNKLRVLRVTISNFIDGGKKKYFKHDWSNGVMNDAQLVEALDYIANNLNDQLHDPQTFHKPDVGDGGN